MSLTEWIANRLPRFSKNARDEAWEAARLFGEKQSGLSRNPSNGQFRSLKPKRTLLNGSDAIKTLRRMKYGALHAGDEDLESLSRTESPDQRRRSSSLPD